MTRYVASSRRPRAFYTGDDWYPDPRETVDVIVEDAGPQDTSLVDQHGVKIYRLPVREKCGF